MNTQDLITDQCLINIDQTMQVSIPDIFESVEVIQLETKEECLISTIQKVVFFNDRYYVLDDRQESLFCFDSSGKFLFKIAAKGEGPEEYLHLGYFNVDTYHNQLLILEPFGSLLSFDLEGRFLSKIKLPREIVAYNEVYPLNKDTLVFLSITKYELVFYSKDKNRIIDKRRYGMDGDIRSYIFVPSHKTYEYNGSVFFSLPVTNKIINLSDNTLFLWDFGNKNNTQKQIDNLKELLKSEEETPKRDFVSEEKLNYTIEHNFESNRYKISLLYPGNLRIKHIFFDKKTKTALVFDKTSENIRFILSDFYGESIIMYDHGWKSNPLLTYYSSDNLSEEQNRIINSHNPEEDNPFLVKYNFKK
jgi:hypothetical protein